ncbi:hypothetical protein VN24_16595 [Paenibacillus beijingensis]|uniref:Uncharacterized protein n=1 Tax=Paenibacillus beijingensis TaxID=1126833 RepID=A0A0D5NKU2_9BACL|nr:hypothetical protein VN24_16595 [Paenibacillus beijingensis]
MIPAQVVHWLPDMIKQFQKDYPNIDDYSIIAMVDAIGERFRQTGEGVSAGALDQRQAAATVHWEQCTVAAGRLN